MRTDVVELAVIAIVLGPAGLHDRVAIRKMIPPIDERDYLAHRAWNEHYRSMYIAEAGVRSSRFVPFTKSLPPLGTWRLDDTRLNYGREIAVLVYVDPSSVVGVELDSRGELLCDRRSDAARYREWMLEGLRAPPVEIVETDQGTLNLLDGHRRLVAARQAGQELLAWVSPTVNTGTGSLDCERRPIKTGLTFEMWTDRGFEAWEGSVLLGSLLNQSIDHERVPGR